MSHSQDHVHEKESINALQITSFSIEDLFNTQKIEACEIAGNEEIIYCDEGGPIPGNSNHAKRKFHPEEDNMIDLPPDKKGGNPSKPSSKKEFDYKRWKKIRQDEKNWKEYGHLPSPSMKKKYVGSSLVWNTTFMETNLRLNLGGYTAKLTDFSNMPEIRSLKEAIAMGLVLVKSSKSHQPLTDKFGRVIAVQAPSPNDASYIGSVKRAYETMKREISQVSLTPKDLDNGKRGNGFLALNVGLSYGNGHKIPTCRGLGRFQPLADALIEDVDIQRLASYQDATYALWHPKAYRYYHTNLNKLWEVYPHLAGQLFPRSIMPTAAFNLGNRVTTKIHVDSQNCPFGWCTITALGDFDATKGGHIVLWDLGIVLEFPAGACVCLPSALVAHSNIPIDESELRMSFTQYCSGEIFRHIENGFKTDGSLEISDPAIMAFRKDARKTRIKEGYSMFSKMDELMEGSGKKKN